MVITLDYLAKRTSAKFLYDLEPESDLVVWPEPVVVLIVVKAPVLTAFIEELISAVGILIDVVDLFVFENFFLLNRIELVSVKLKSHFWRHRELVFLVLR